MPDHRRRGVAMVLTPRIGLLLATLAAAAALVLAGPGTATARASGCKRFGSDEPARLSHSHARGAIRCLLNDKRTEHGLSRLRANKRLSVAATQHTKYMNAHRCFEHQCPGEASPLARLENVGYIVSGLLRWRYGENIAWGSGSLGTPKGIVRAWMHSPEHRRNILDGTFRQIGVGFDRGYPGNPHGSGGTYTTDFGTRKP